jgi:hypothetical protein
MRSRAQAYIDIDNTQEDPVLFQKRWFASVDKTLSGVINGAYTKPKAVNYLIQIRDAFNLISQNINNDLPGEEQVLMRNIFSTSIHVLNSAIKTSDFSKIGIVHSTIHVLVEGWK